MQAPLFEVKNKLSEYVHQAENGETIELTKHGETTVVLISRKEYEELTNSGKISFKSLYETWKKEFPSAGAADAQFPYDTIRSKEVDDSGRSSVW
jgi:prevent-host-death family protein